ncbi:hypothetical protein HDU76_000714 [Blyttiomyces sp. JEL0837]|nr:hypothetical protein HDU76_000714 [Blyttiomyces sp. JEL0837]
MGTSDSSSSVSSTTPLAAPTSAISPTNRSTPTIRTLPTETLFEILYRSHNPKLLAIALCRRDAMEAFEDKDRKGNIYITEWKQKRLGEPLIVWWCRCGNLKTSVASRSCNDEVVFLVFMKKLRAIVREWKDLSSM